VGGEPSADRLDDVAGYNDNEPALLVGPSVGYWSHGADDLVLHVGGVVVQNREAVAPTDDGAREERDS
jgi:hypothetical protein